MSNKVNGRPSRLATEKDLQDKIAKLIAEGNFVEVACDAVGVARSSFYLWLKKGEDATDGEYRDFYIAITKASAKAEVTAVGDVRSGAQNWQSRAWWLERRYPERWGRKDAPIKVTRTNLDGTKEYVPLTDEERVTRIAAILDAARARRNGQDIDIANSEGLDPETITNPT